MTIKNILRNTPNILKAIYLLWILINLYLLLSNFNRINAGFYGEKFYSYFDHSYTYTIGGLDFYYKSKVFFPFTSPYILDMKFVEFYDGTEFIFYLLAPIILYLIFRLIFSKRKISD